MYKSLNASPMSLFYIAPRVPIALQNAIFIVCSLYRFHRPGGEYQSQHDNTTTDNDILHILSLSLSTVYIHMYLYIYNLHIYFNSN